MPVELISRPDSEEAFDLDVRKVLGVPQASEQGRTAPSLILCSDICASVICASAIC